MSDGDDANGERVDYSFHIRIRVCGVPILVISSWVAALSTDFLGARACVRVHVGM